MGDLDREGLLSTRNLRTVAGLLAALLLLAAGVVAGRGSVSPASGGTAAATGSRVPGWPGASQLVAGAPGGYAHTEAGAVDAATNYQLLLAGPLLTTPVKYREAERVIYVPAVRDRLMATAEQGLTSLQDQTQLLSNASKGVPVAVMGVPISYHVDSYDGDHATVCARRLKRTTHFGIGGPAVSAETDHPFRRGGPPASGLDSVKEGLTGR